MDYTVFTHRKSNLALAAALGALLIGAPSLALARDGGGGHGGGPGPSGASSMAAGGAGGSGASGAAATGMSDRGRNPAAGHNNAVDMDGPGHEANDANEAAREAAREANDANEAAREAANEANEAAREATGAR